MRKIQEIKGLKKKKRRRRRRREIASHSQRIRQVFGSVICGFVSESGTIYAFANQL